MLQKSINFTLILLQKNINFTLIILQNYLFLNFKRHISSELHRWKSKANRKPLVLRGARQVGKTTTVRHFSKTYAHSILLNLEKVEHKRYFEDYDNAKTIVDALFVAYNIASTEKENTLLFIDEIQESPKAIALLRYFYEDVSSLHVIAAGSLLEHVMDKVKSFPVGRVEYLYVHPFNFIEYIEAKQHVIALEQLDKTPIKQFAHQTVMQLFNEYVIVGGMPEVVTTFLETGSIADLPQVYESIWSTYKNDIEKYASNATETRVIRHVVQTAHLYIDQRIKFENFGKSNYRSREVGEAMRNLNDAGVIKLLYPTTEVTPPIKPNLKKAPRLQFLDTGLLNYELKIQVSMLGVDDLNTIYKGAIIPHMILQEVISLNTLSYKMPHFWVREKAQSSSEVDLVVQHENFIIPIEIKSGKAGTLKSLHQFMERVDHPYAIRMYAGEFSVEQHQTPIGKTPYLLMNLPYYLGIKLDEYIRYFIAEYKLK